MTSFIGTDGFSYAPANAQHPGRRTEQQDSFAFSDPGNRDFMSHGGLLAVLADGMGGLAHGAEASRIAVQTFVESYANKEREEDIPGALRRALEDADRAVFEFAATAFPRDEAGSTLVAAVLAARRLFWVSVGDSAVYLHRQRRLTMLNQPHTLGSRLDRMAARGEMSADDAQSNPDREALTSYIGIGGLLEIDGDETGAELVPGDFVLLCTDGLFRALDPMEIAGVLETADSSQDACEALIAQALARDLPHQDNITVLGIAVDQP